MYSLNPAGTQELEEFWKTWSFLTQRIDSLRTEDANTEDTHTDTNNKEN